MKILRNYFIGNFLKRTDDVFEQARAIMLYQFSLAFLIIFMLPLGTDIIMEYHKGTILHSIDTILIFHFLFLLRKTTNLDHLINYFFALCNLSSLFAFMIFNPMRIDPLGMTWLFSFVTLSALMQKGITRIVYCCFFVWIPAIYAFTNIKMDGALTIKILEQAGAENPPAFLMLIPISLSVYAIWSHTGTIKQAKETITHQKQLIEEKNKDITDSIIYAKRIQQSLLPQESYIEKTLNRMKNK
jgi:hypothetical protein